MATPTSLSALSWKLEKMLPKVFALLAKHTHEAKGLSTVEEAGPNYDS